jgi:hypothetical protein
MEFDVHSTDCSALLARVCVVCGVPDACGLCMEDGMRDNAIAFLYFMHHLSYEMGSYLRKVSFGTGAAELN